MAMRQAAFTSGDPDGSAKLRRLIDLVDEAGENNHKVVVFSYFRSVLATVHRALGSRAVGPLTGSVPPTHRQGMVDHFTSADGHAVLVAQIQAGGVGLNMQAASVAILCEPQVKPTTEAQAVARLHRMGQVRKVQVHRLLTVDSVDQRMLELLDSKQRLFDDYARVSATATASPEAIDISEADLARRIVEEEQERLAREAMGAQPRADPPRPAPGPSPAHQASSGSAKPRRTRMSQCTNCGSIAPRPVGEVVTCTCGARIRVPDDPPS